MTFNRRWSLHPIDDFALPDGRKIDGVMGYDILEAIRIEMRRTDALMTWSYSGVSKTASVSPSASEAGAKRTFVLMPLMTHARGSSLTVQFRQIPRFLGIGLAAERTIIHIRKDEWPSRKLPDPLETADPGFDVLDSGEKGSWRPIARKAIETTGQLNIGGVPYEDVPVIVVEEISSTGVLGLDFLRGFERTTIDFSKQYLKLEGEFTAAAK